MKSLLILSVLNLGTMKSQLEGNQRAHVVRLDDEADVRNP